MATDAKNVRRELQQPATTQIRVRYARLTPSLQGGSETERTSPQFWGDGISNFLFPLYVGEGIRYQPYAQKCAHVRPNRYSQKCPKPTIKPQFRRDDCILNVTV